MPYEEIVPENLMRVMDVNLNAPFLHNRAGSKQDAGRGCVAQHGSYGSAQILHARLIGYEARKANALLLAND